MRSTILAAAGALALGCANPALAQTSPPARIEVGETVRGVLEAREVETADRGWLVDFYDLRLRRGETVTVTLTSTSFDAFLDIDFDGGHRYEDDDAAGGPDGTDAQVVFEAEEAGLYRINVTSFERDRTGGYTLTVQRGGQIVVPAQTTAPAAARERPDPRPIRMGQTLSGRLTPLSPLHSDDTPYLPFTFEGRQGDSIAVAMNAEAFDAYLILRKAGQDRDLARDDDGGGGTNALLNYVLPENATYEIRANAVEPTAVGPFELTLAQARSPAERASPISPGQTVRGSLSAEDLRGRDNAFFDPYRFEGRARQRVVITLVSNDFDAFLTLLDADGRELASNDDSPQGTDSEIAFTLPSNGLYFIMASSLEGGERGAYLLGLSVSGP